MQSEPRRRLAKNDQLLERRHFLDWAGSCLKVVQVVPHYFPYVGGINTHIKLLSEALVREGTEVQVYTTDPSRSLKKSEVINGVEVRRFNSFAPNDAYCFSLTLFNALRKTKADIIHAHGIHDLPLLLSASAKNHSKVPLVSTFYYHGKGHTFFRNVLFQFYKQTLAEYVLRKTDLLISLSEYEKELGKSDFRTNVRVTVIPACLRIDWSEHTSLEIGKIGPDWEIYSRAPEWGKETWTHPYIGFVFKHSF